MHITSLLKNAQNLAKIMSLVPDYDSSDSSSSDSDEYDQSSLETIASIAAQKLPKPGFLINQRENDCMPTSSVFANPFIQAENTKKAILEKHVKMVNTKENTHTINGKKVCWNYRKGRCRFGHNCKYAHDSDLQRTEEQLQSGIQIEQTVICQTTQHKPSSAKEQIKTENFKRKRPGLSEGLVPGKKVMKMYENQKKF